MVPNEDTVQQLIAALIVALQARNDSNESLIIFEKFDDNIESWDIFEKRLENYFIYVDFQVMIKRYNIKKNCKFITLGGV